MSFFNRADVKPTQGEPLPKTENPNNPPPALPPLSPERSQAIAALMANGWTDAEGGRHSVRSVAHAEFLAKCGEIELPI